MEHELSHEVKTPSSVTSGADTARAMMEQMKTGTFEPEPGPVMTVEHEIPQPPSAPAGPPAIPAPTGQESLATLRSRNEQLTVALGNLQNLLNDENRETWKQKYKTLDGILKARSKEDRARISELETEIKVLQDELDCKNGGEAEPVELNLDDEDRRIVDELGISSETYNRMLNKMGKGNHPVSTDKSLDTIRQSFFTTIETLSPGWQDVMKDPGFVKYLNAHMDQSSGKPLMDVLKEADKASDAVSVAAIYNGFFGLSKNSRGKMSRPLEPVSGSRGGRGFSDRQAPFLSKKDYLEFSRSLTNGTFKGTREEAEQRRQEFLAALQGERVVE